MTSESIGSKFQSSEFQENDQGEHQKVYDSTLVFFINRKRWNTPSILIDWFIFTLYTLRQDLDLFTLHFSLKNVGQYSLHAKDWEQHRAGIQQQVWSMRTGNLMWNTIKGYLLLVWLHQHCLLFLVLLLRTKLSFLFPPTWPSAAPPQAQLSAIIFPLGT